jgi:sortase (surface protein transpeptidase)
VPTGLAAAWTAAGARNVVGPPARAQNRSTGPAPVRIEIPSIRVDSAIDPMGLNPDGSLQVPTDFARTGYYTGRSRPGDAGPAIVVGHIDDKSGPAAFYRLRDLRPGAEVRIHRADNSVVIFAVERAKEVSKNAFPTDEVYGPTSDPTLRLITCGGSFDRSTGHYRDNTVVFLRMKG